MTDDPEAQSALGAWGDSADGEDSGDEGDEVAVERDDNDIRVNTLRNAALSDDAVLTDDSCPWCLHPADEFRRNERNGLLGCSNCGAVIPEDADWYVRGEKIVV